MNQDNSALLHILDLEDDFLNDVFDDDLFSEDIAELTASERQASLTPAWSIEEFADDMRAFEDE